MCQITDGAVHMIVLLRAFQLGFSAMEVRPRVRLPDACARCSVAVCAAADGPARPTSSLRASSKVAIMFSL